MKRSEEEIKTLTEKKKKLKEKVAQLEASYKQLNSQYSTKKYDANNSYRRQRDELQTKGMNLLAKYKTMFAASQKL